MQTLIILYCIITSVVCIGVLFIGNVKYKTALKAEQAERNNRIFILQHLFNLSVSRKQDGLFFTIKEKIEYDDGSGYYVTLEPQPTLDEAFDYAWRRWTDPKINLGYDRYKWNGEKFVKSAARTSYGTSSNHSSF